MSTSNKRYKERQLTSKNHTSTEPQIVITAHTKDESREKRTLLCKAVFNNKARIELQKWQILCLAKNQNLIHQYDHLFIGTSKSTCDEKVAPLICRKGAIWVTCLLHPNHEILKMLQSLLPIFLGHGCRRKRPSRPYQITASSQGK